MAGNKRPRLLWDLFMVLPVDHSSIIVMCKFYAQKNRILLHVTIFLCKCF